MVEYKGYKIIKGVNMYNIHTSEYARPLYSYFESIKDAKDFIDTILN